MSEYGPVFEAYLDAYMKEFTCSREVAEQHLNDVIKLVQKDKNENTN